MKEERLYKIIKSDLGLSISIVSLIVTGVWGASGLYNSISNLKDVVLEISTDNKQFKIDQNIRDTNQDTKIVQNSVNIANIQGSLNQRGIVTRQFSVVPIEASTTALQ